MPPRPRIARDHAARNLRGGEATAQPLDPGLGWIERMRVYRGRPERDMSVGAALGGLERSFSARQRALGDVIDAWNDLAPPTMRATVEIAGLTQGTLTVHAAGSSAGYELARILRSGLERAIVARLPGRVRRIKVRVVGSGSADDVGSAHD